MSPADFSFKAGSFSSGFREILKKCFVVCSLTKPIAHQPPRTRNRTGDLLGVFLGRKAPEDPVAFSKSRLLQVHPSEHSCLKSEQKLFIKKQQPVNLKKRGWIQFFSFRVKIKSKDANHGALDTQCSILTPGCNWWVPVPIHKLHPPLFAAPTNKSADKNTAISFIPAPTDGSAGKNTELFFNPAPTNKSADKHTALSFIPAQTDGSAVTNTALSLIPAPTIWEHWHNTALSFIPAPTIWEHWHNTALSFIPAPTIWERWHRHCTLLHSCSNYLGALTQTLHSPSSLLQLFGSADTNTALNFIPATTIREHWHKHCLQLFGSADTNTALSFILAPTIWERCYWHCTLHHPCSNWWERWHKHCTLPNPCSNYMGALIQTLHSSSTLLQFYGSSDTDIAISFLKLQLELELLQTYQLYSSMLQLFGSADTNTALSFILAPTIWERWHKHCTLLHPCSNSLCQSWYKVQTLHSNFSQLYLMEAKQYTLPLPSLLQLHGAKKLTLHSANALLQLKVQELTGARREH